MIVAGKNQAVEDRLGTPRFLFLLVTGIVKEAKRFRIESAPVLDPPGNLLKDFLLECRRLGLSGEFAQGWSGQNVGEQRVTRDAVNFVVSLTTLGG